MIEARLEEENVLGEEILIGIVARVLGSLGWHVVQAGTDLRAVRLLRRWIMRGPVRIFLKALARGPRPDRPITALS